MILVDTNLLVYAVNARAPEHARAKSWLEAQFAETSRVALPWGSLLGFLRLVTNARVVAHPLRIEQAWSEVDRWIGMPNVWVPGAGWRHAEILRGLLVPGGSANLVPDAHLAALAIEHGLTLCSTDRDFAGFPGLKWVNPLRG